MPCSCAQVPASTPSGISEVAHSVIRSFSRLSDVPEHGPHGTFFGVLPIDKGQNPVDMLGVGAEFPNALIDVGIVVGGVVAGAMEFRTMNEIHQLDSSSGVPPSDVFCLN